MIGTPLKGLSIDLYCSIHLSFRETVPLNNNSEREEVAISRRHFVAASTRYFHGTVGTGNPSHPPGTASTPDMEIPEIELYQVGWLA